MFSTKSAYISSNLESLPHATSHTAVMATSHGEARFLAGIGQFVIRVVEYSPGRIHTFWEGQIWPGRLISHRRRLIPHRETLTADFFCTAKWQSKARLSEHLGAPFFLARDRGTKRYYVHWNQTGRHSMIQQKEYCMWFQYCSSRG